MGQFNRRFFLLWQGQALSQLGNQAFLVAATYVTLEGTGSASLVAVVMIASTLPAVIVGPVAGTFADRHSRRAVLVATDLLRGLAVGGCGLFLLWGPAAATARFGALVLAAVVGGILGAFFGPAAQAFVPDLVPADRLASANARLQLSGQASTLVGQALGGIAYAAWGAVALLVFDGASFVYAGLSTALLPADRRERPPPARPGARLREYAAQTREGLAYVRDRPGMLPLLLAFSGVNLLFMPVFVLLPLFVRDILGRGPEWYGFLLAASGAGALAGSLVAGSVRARTGSPAALVAGCVAGVAGGVLVLAAARHPWVALAAFAAIGLLASIINVIVITVFQSAAPAAVRGRVMAVVIALSGAVVPLGMAVGGVLGDLWREALPALFAACGLGIAMLVGFVKRSAADLVAR